MLDYATFLCFVGCNLLSSLVLLSEGKLKSKSFPLKSIKRTDPSSKLKESEHTMFFIYSLNAWIFR